MDATQLFSAGKQGATAGSAREENKTGSTIGGIVGGIAGAYFGGPIGAMIGSQLGAYLGGQIEGQLAGESDEELDQRAEDAPFGGEGVSYQDGLAKAIQMGRAAGVDEEYTDRLEEVLIASGGEVPADNGVYDDYSDELKGAVVEDGYGATLSDSEDFTDATDYSFDDSGATVEGYASPDSPILTADTGADTGLTV
jgi:hypothetical protein